MATVCAQSGGWACPYGAVHLSPCLARARSSRCASSRRGAEIRMRGDICCLRVTRCIDCRAAHADDHTQLWPNRLLSTGAGGEAVADAEEPRSTSCLWEASACAAVARSHAHDRSVTVCGRICFDARLSSRRNPRALVVGDPSLYRTVLREACADGGHRVVA